MPIYEYLCPSCEFKFELLRPLSQASETASCPRCHKTVERILSTFSSFSMDKSGVTSSLGGSPCATCDTPSCSSCGM